MKSCKNTRFCFKKKIFSFEFKIFWLSFQLGNLFHFHVNKFYLCKFQSSFTKLSLTHKWLESIYLSIIRIVVCSNTFIIVFMHLKSKSMKVKCITMIHVLRSVHFLPYFHHHSAWVEKMYKLLLSFFQAERQKFSYYTFTKIVCFK